MKDDEYTAACLLGRSFDWCRTSAPARPQTGAELRGMLSYGSRVRDEAYERGQEAWDTAVDRGKEYFESGKETMQKSWENRPGIHGNWKRRSKRPEQMSNEASRLRG